jgi:molybdenum cofactor cytidylyltransferase
MGRPKLLLPIAGATMIGRVVTELRAGGVNLVIVVAPPAAASAGAELAAEARRRGAEVIVPETHPAEMRDSIELGLEALARGIPPRRVLIAPGDTPGITRDLVARLLEYAGRASERIVVPCCGGRRGHPIVLPWSIALEVRSLPAGVGVNALLDRHEKHLATVTIENPDLIVDIDTPAELDEWNARRAARDWSVVDHRFSDNAGPPGPAKTVTVRVRLFALAKERAGRSEIELEVGSPATVGSLREAIREHSPALRPLVPNVLIAVNEEYAGDDELIPHGARIALIPPVSGGAGEPWQARSRIQAGNRRSSRP